MPLKGGKDLYKANIRRKKSGKKTFIHKKAFAFAQSEEDAKRFIKRRHPGFTITRISIN